MKTDAGGVGGEVEKKNRVPCDVFGQDTIRQTSGAVCHMGTWLLTLPCGFVATNS